MSLLLFTGGVISSHTVEEGGLILVAFCFALTRCAVVSEVLGHSVCPAISYWLAFCVVALADEGSLFGFGSWRGDSFGTGGLKSANCLGDEVGNVCWSHRVG